MTKLDDIAGVCQLLNRRAADERNTASAYRTLGRDYLALLHQSRAEAYEAAAIELAGKLPPGDALDDLTVLPDGT